MPETYPLKYSKQKPYNRYSDYLKAVFGKPMQKISIDAGFTCPNIDGTIGTGGCIYCDNRSFNPNYQSGRQHITEQIDSSIQKFSNRKPNTGFIAYFQSHTNTHAGVAKLEKIYRQAIAHPKIEALIIATRPDCLSDAVLNFLAQLNREVFTGIEIGIESTRNDTLAKINRGHSWEQTLDTIYRVKAHGLHLGGHLILGLPDEDVDMMLDHARTLAQLPLDTIKMHQIQIIKNTRLSALYNADPARITLFTVEAYIDFCIRFAERCNPDLVIERFASESKPGLLAVKMWGGIKNSQIADHIVNEMRRRNTWQGRLWQPTD